MSVLVRDYLAARVSHVMVHYLLFAILITVYITTSHLFPPLFLSARALGLVQCLHGSDAHGRNAAPTHHDSAGIAFCRAGENDHHAAHTWLLGPQSSRKNSFATEVGVGRRLAFFEHCPME